MKKTFLGIDISVGSYEDILSEIVCLAKSSTSGYVCVANVHMLVEAHRDSSFAAIVNHSVICTPDGMPLVWGLNKTYSIKQDRIAGMDLLPDLLNAAQSNSIPVLFYGGTDDMLKQTEVYVRNKYPSLDLRGTYSPPFRALTTSEEEAVVNRLNKSGAQIIFVVLGCPKQEKWMNTMSSKINAILIGIGGALPVMIGMQSRAPMWMQKLGLEWFYRLSQEPGRLFQRYWSTNLTFMLLLTKNLFNTHFIKMRNQNEC